MCIITCLRTQQTHFLGLCLIALTQMIMQDKHLIPLGSNHLPKKILHEKLHRAFSEIQSGWTSWDKLVEEGMWPTALAISSVEGPEL